MHRISVVGVMLVPLVGISSPNAAPGPVVRFSVYAPVQDDSPVHIVALHYGYYSVGFSLTNASDKSVDDVSIAGVAIAPPGCGAEPRKSRFVIGNAFGRVRIGPNGNADALENDSGFHTGFLVFQATSLEAAYLQVQAKISEVDFEDGTKWKLQIDPQASPFDPSLVAVDAWKCPDAASVIEALKEIHIVSSDRKIEKALYGGDAEPGVPPRLFFGCRLDGRNGFCPSD